MPIVSVIVPCRNERAHVEAFAASALAQAVPAGWQLEAIVADGGSDDGTRELLAGLAVQDERLRVVDNPARTVSAGLNQALGAARGAVIVRMDVHTTYAPDYVAECLAALRATGADNVGGPWRAGAAADGAAMPTAIAAAFQSAAVAGGALSRRLDHDGPVDTVYLGAWPRSTFERFGAFDEALVRNQDDEHNLRIVRGGGRIWQSSRIRSTYRPRATLKQVFGQYLQYGYWKPLVMKKHGQAASLRHVVPALFVLALGVVLVTALVGAAWWPLALLAGAYSLAVAVLSAGVARTAAAGSAVLLRVPLVVATYHVAYGVGSILGWCDVLLGRHGRGRFATLTR